MMAKTIKTIALTLAVTLIVELCIVAYWSAQAPKTYHCTKLEYV